MKALIVSVALGVLSMIALQGGLQPAADYHQHLYSPTIVRAAPGTQPITASDLIGLLNLARIRRAVVLSQAYAFGNPNRPAVDDEYAQVKMENDWTSREVAQFPDRLVGFCGVNPLRNYALEEIARCAN